MAQAGTPSGPASLGHSCNLGAKARLCSKGRAFLARARPGGKARATSGPRQGFQCRGRAGGSVPVVGLLELPAQAHAPVAPRLHEWPKLARQAGQLPWATRAISAQRQGFAAKAGPFWQGHGLVARRALPQGPGKAFNAGEGQAAQYQLLACLNSQRRPTPQSRRDCTNGPSWHAKRASFPGPFVQSRRKGKALQQRQGLSGKGTAWWQGARYLRAQARLSVQGKGRRLSTSCWPA